MSKWKMSDCGGDNNGKSEATEESVTSVESEGDSRGDATHDMIIRGLEGDEIDCQ